jgi:hypothetical protein
MKDLTLRGILELAFPGEALVPRAALKAVLDSYWQCAPDWEAHSRMRALADAAGIEICEDYTWVGMRMIHLFKAQLQSDNPGIDIKDGEDEHRSWVEWQVEGKDRQLLFSEEWFAFRWQEAPGAEHEQIMESGDGRRGFRFWQAIKGELQRQGLKVNIEGDDLESV